MIFVVVVSEGNGGDEDGSGVEEDGGGAVTGVVAGIVTRVVTGGRWPTPAWK